MKASDPQNGELSPGDDSPGVAVSSGSSRGPIKARGNQSMMISIVAIAIGASLGALLRWYLANRLNSTFPQLPPGTLVANILGAYLIGIAIAVFLTFPTLSPQWRLLTVTGFLGGLTTFSTFSAEVVTAILEGRGVWAISTIAAHVIGSIVMTLCGVGTVRLIRTLI